MSRTSRLLDLLELLQSSGTRTVPELAQRFGIDERTARRDIEALRDLGVPVEAIRGRYGGYRVSAGYRMPPLVFDDAEAIAVLVALTQAATRTATVQLSSGLATAMAKIRRSLPERLAERAATLLDTAVISPGPHADPAPAVDPDVVLTVAAAVRDRRPIALAYRNRSGESSHRSLQPHDLVAYSGRWYLAGLDAATQQVRTFRLDRVTSAHVLGGTFPAPPPHDAVADLTERLVTAGYRHEVVLRIRATVGDVRRDLPASVARLEPLDPDWLRATIHSESLEWLPGALLALGAEVVVEQPDELRTVLQEAADRLSSWSRSPS
ncbi:putative DNA-binding transcriptional regulator YafY [Friedmanniella endophytica]|uniref:Putative DNA-binding transcriptional regulator YafY n=1 Tax=Microlunatus kandeliicorticis TaxID=1759536 RepID=A0A7W3IT47_9ACTN|nr:YafY family protein [Microlunatus kandeliicorticis]MBA8794747.1 putative DNA-binding transcriptional regulator YafY [Microlunatus kandeliicorticis]